MLGLFRQVGPCSAYRVRKIFQASPTPAWSGSTGAVYPAVRRLSEAGLLRSIAGDDRRGTRLHSVTARGNRALKRWFDVDAMGPELVGPPADTLRCHVSLLGVLSDAEQRRFLDRAEEALRRGVRDLEARLATAPGDDRFARFAERGSLALARARLRWLGELRAALDRDA